MLTNRVGYAVVDNTTATLKTGPAGFFGFVVVTGGDVTVYDNTAGSGVVLFTKTGMTAGEVVQFGGLGYAANNGLTVVTTGKVNVAYT